MQDTHPLGFVPQVPVPRQEFIMFLPALDEHGEFRASFQHVQVTLQERLAAKETWAYWDTNYGVQNEWGLSIGVTWRSISLKCAACCGHVGVADASEVSVVVKPGEPLALDHTDDTSRSVDCRWT